MRLKIKRNGDYFKNVENLSKIMQAKVILTKDYDKNN